MDRAGASYAGNTGFDYQQKNDEKQSIIDGLDLINVIKKWGG